MPLTLAQYSTIKELKKLVAGGEPICRETLAEAHRIGYSRLADAASNKVSAYVIGNLKSTAFLKALEPIKCLDWLTPVRRGM